MVDLNKRKDRPNGGGQDKRGAKRSKVRPVTSLSQQLEPTRHRDIPSEVVRGLEKRLSLLEISVKVRVVLFVEIVTSLILLPSVAVLIPTATLSFVRMTEHSCHSSRDGRFHQLCLTNGSTT
jgi:hypothetical protein